MLLNIIVFAFSSSIDSFGIGVTYGLKRTNLNISSNLIILLLSIISTSFSIFIGNKLTIIFNTYYIKFLGAFILVILGVIIIMQILNCNIKVKSNINKKKIKKNWFVNYLKRILEILKNPISSDVDNSSNIDIKESFSLGIALSIDSFCIGIGSSILGFNSIIFPILVAFFQLAFLSLGRFLGRKAHKISNIPDNLWNFISGILLILIGISRILV